LAVAITSALHKFAPEHTVQVARSFRQALDLAAKTKPELIVVDFDPPQAGEVAFITELKRTNPRSRMLVIAPGISARLAGERGPSAAIHFVEKPFGLAEFGAAVQALLNQSVPSEALSKRGSLRDLHVADLVQLKCLARAAAVLRVETADRHIGEIHFVAGQVCHATTSQVQGAEAFAEIVSWRDVRFNEIERLADAPRTIHGPWDTLLLEALENARVAGEESAVEADAAANRERNGSKIVVVDDTEMLLIFVEDILLSWDPTLQITTAQTGIEGLAEISAAAPDLVLLDYSLPDITGGEVCRRLLSAEATARIPVVLMSGHVPEMQRVAEENPNVVAAVAKPFFSDELLTAVQKALASGPVESAAEPGSTAMVEPEPQPDPHTELPASHQHENSGNGKHAVKGVQTPSEFPAPATPFPAPPEAPAPSFLSPAPSRSLADETQAVTPAAATPLHRAAAVSAGESEVVMTLALLVTSMQFTPQFRVGTMRARPASPVAALRVESEQPHGELLVQTGFNLGPVQLDKEGRFAGVRLLPNQQPVTRPRSQSSFQIGGVAVVPADSDDRVQFTTAEATPMTVQLSANLKLTSIELSPAFDIAALILQASTRQVSVSVQTNGPTPAHVEPTALFTIGGVELDASGGVEQLILNPVD
jgi:CheY-like chemotaxis protein